MGESSTPTDLAAAETWFARNGLTYFVPSERAAARQALKPGRTAPLLLVVALVAGTLGGLLAWLVGELSAAPALLVSLGLAALGWYALTALRLRPILAWALGRTFGSLRLLLPMATRALPLLLLFMTFLFINAEVWQLSASLAPGVLWLLVLLLGGLAVAFLLVRLPEEVDRADDAVDDAFLRRACRGTPLEAACEELLADATADPASRAEVTGFERWNLVLVLLVIQAVQVLLLVAMVFAFFLLFGSLAMGEQVQLAWTARESITSLTWLPSVSVELVKVALFLAAFSGLYFTVSAVTDETYREQFFSGVTRHVERAVGMRAVYLALRARTAA